MLCLQAQAAQQALDQAKEEAEAARHEAAEAAQREAGAAAALQQAASELEVRARSTATLSRPCGRRPQSSRQGSSSLCTVGPKAQRR